MSIDRRAWRDANAHLFAPPPRSDTGAAQIVADLQTISRKLDTVQRETTAAESTHHEVIRSISRELHTLGRLPFPTHDELATPESCFAAIEAIRQRLNANAADTAQRSPERSGRSAHAANSADLPLRRVSPDRASHSLDSVVRVSEGGAVQALRRVYDVLGGDLAGASADDVTLARQAGDLAVDVTRRLETLTRDHVVSVSAFEAYARDVRTAFAGIGVVAPDAGEYVRRAADPTALTVLSESARRSTEWYSAVVAKLRIAAANLNRNSSDSIKPTSVTALADAIQEGSKEFAAVANRNVAERSAAQIAILADLNLDDHQDLNAARGQIAKLHGALDAAVAEFTGASHDSPTLSLAVARATGVLRAAVGGADRLVASRVEEWVSSLRAAAGRPSSIDELSERIVVAPRDILEREIESCLAALAAQREATAAQIIQLEERLDAATTTSTSLTTAAASFAAELQSRVRFDVGAINDGSADGGIVDRVRSLYHDVMARLSDMETTLARVTRQCDASRLERVRVEELVKGRLAKLLELAATASASVSGGDALVRDDTATAQDVATRLDRLEVIVTDALRHAEKSEIALQAEKVRISNFNDTQRKLSKRCRAVMTEINELCAWLGVRAEEVEGDGLGPMQWLGVMQTAIARCKETCAVAGDDESERPTPVAVGPAKVKASAMALRHCADLQAELSEARASEQQLSESLVATSRLLGKSLAKAKALMRMWSIDLEAEAANESRHVFTVTLEGRGDVRYCDTDEVSDEVELSSVPMHYRVVSLGEAMDFFAVALPQATERLVSCCGYLQRVYKELTGGQKVEISDGYFSDLVSSVSHLSDQVLIALRHSNRPPAALASSGNPPPPSGPHPLERNNARLVTSPERPERHLAQREDSPPRRLDELESEAYCSSAALDHHAATHRATPADQTLADHRLVRVAIAVSRAWTAMTTIAEVKYLRLGSAAAAIMCEGEGKSSSIVSGRSFFPWLPTDHDLLRDVRQVRVDVLHDTLVPELENAAAKLESLIKAFSEGFKRSSIVVQRDIDTIQNYLYAGLDAVNRTVNVEGLVQDPAKFDDVLRAIAPESRRLQEGWYFFDRPDGEGKSVYSVAADYSRALLDTLVHVSARWKELVDAQKRELAQIHEAIEQRIVVPGLARGDADPWAVRCRALRDAAANSSLLQVIEFVADEVTKAHCSASFMGSSAMSRVAELELAVNRLMSERDAAASSAAVARAMLHRVSTTSHPTAGGARDPSPGRSLSRQPSDAPLQSKDSSPLSRNLSYSRTSTSQSAAAAPPDSRARLNDSLSSIGGPRNGKPATATHSRTSSITRSEPLSPALRKASPTVPTQRRIGQLNSVHDLPKSPERVSRHLQRSHYFHTVVQEYAQSLDDELMKRKTMSPPRAEVQLSPMTASPRSVARHSPLRSRSAAEKRRLQSYARMHSGKSASGAGAKEPLVGGGDVRVVHAAKGTTVRSLSQPKRR